MIHIDVAICLGHLFSLSHDSIIITSLDTYILQSKRVDGYALVLDVISKVIYYIQF